MNAKPRGVTVKTQDGQEIYLFPGGLEKLRSMFRKQRKTREIKSGIKKENVGGKQ